MFFLILFHIPPFDLDLDTNNLDQYFLQGIILNFTVNIIIFSLFLRSFLYLYLILLLLLLPFIASHLYHWWYLHPQLYSKNFLVQKIFLFTYLFLLFLVLFILSTPKLFKCIFLKLTNYYLIKDFILLIFYY